MNPIRILAIDGGGIRGVIPATILQSIQSRLPSPIHNYFELIVGVSAGAILSYGLTAPRATGNSENTPLISISDIISLYREKSSCIFSSSTPSLLNFGATSAKYSADGIEGVLQGIFKDTTISQSLTPSITVSYCTEYRRPIFF